MRMTPADLAGPLLGGRGAHLRAGAGALGPLVALGVAVLVGLSVQLPCLSGGYELPRAAFRMCASPVGFALDGVTAPEVVGRSAGLISGFSPATYWFVVAAQSLGADAAAAMPFLLLVSVASLAVAGAALVRIAQRLAAADGAAGARLLSWPAVALCAPALALGIGASADVLGLACALTALALLAGGFERGRVVGAGALLALGAFASPLALLVAAALLIALLRRGEPLALLAGSLLGVLGLLALADGRIVGRIGVWADAPLDVGSAFAVIAERSGAADSSLIGASYVVWLLASAAALWAIASRLLRSEPAAGPADSAASETSGAATTAATSDAATAESTASAALTALEIRTALAGATALLAIACALSPAGPTTTAMWIAPFAALCVRELWVWAVWGLSEIAFAVSANLALVSAIDPSIGLEPMWAQLIALVRVFVLLLIAAAAVTGLSDRLDGVASKVTGDRGGDYTREVSALTR